MNKANLTTMSEYVTLFCHNMGVNINPLKLQKLLYYVQSWHIAKFEKETLYDALPEAWVNGPVYRQIYDLHKASFFRNANFKTDLDEVTLSDALQQKQAELGLEANQLELVNKVLEVYSKMSDERLVLMTHSELPWNEARQGLSPIDRSDRKLSVDTIYNYFNRKK